MRAYKDASIFACKFLPGLPNNHIEFNVPVLVLFTPRIASFPKSIFIFKRLGITVSIFIVFSKTAPPTFTRASQFPVGDDCSVVVLKILKPSTALVCINFLYSCPCGEMRLNSTGISCGRLPVLSSIIQFRKRLSPGRHTPLSPKINPLIPFFISSPLTSNLLRARALPSSSFKYPLSLPFFAISR